MKRLSSYASSSLVRPQPLKIGRPSIEDHDTGIRLSMIRVILYENNSSSSDGLPCDTEAGLLYLKQLFPVEKFHNTLPPLVLKNQVYSIIHDKTTVDREMVRWLCSMSAYFCRASSHF